MGTHILVAEDEESLRMVISQVLEEDGHKVTAVANAELALEEYKKSSYSVVITDIVMDGMTGLDLLAKVKELDSDAVVIVMTSHASIDTATSALRSGAYDFLIKPFEELDVISAVVHRAVEKAQLIGENKKLMKGLQSSRQDLARLNRNLKVLANQDDLTGLYNRRFFMEALEVELIRSRRHEHTFSLIYADLDYFKHYNDHHGHLAGDELLRTLGELFRKRSRATTIVGRHGGEEFAFIVPETDKDGAKAFAEAIREMVEGYPFKGSEEQPMGKVTLSLGVASYPGDGLDCKTLIAAADKALYEAKSAGRNKVRG